VVLTRPTSQKAALAAALLLIFVVMAPAQMQMQVQRRDWLRDLQTAQQNSTGPRGVLTETFDAWIRGQRLFARDSLVPLTTPYQEIDLGQAGQHMAADGERLYVWTEGEHLLRFTLDADGRVNPAIELAVDNAEARQALERARTFPAALVGAPRETEAAHTNDGVAISPSRLFVTNSGGGIAGTISGDSVSVISTSTNAIFATIAGNAGDSPTDVAVVPNNSKGYIANYGCSSCAGRGVTSFDPSSLGTGARLSAQYPYVLAVTSDGARVFVGDFLTLRVYDQNANQLSTTTMSAPIARMAVSPDNQTLFVLLSGTLTANGVTVDSVVVEPVANPVSNPKSLPLPTNSGCTAMAITGDGKRLYVGCSTTPTIFRMDIFQGSLSQSLVVPSHQATGLAVSPDGLTLYAAYFDANSVDVLDSMTLTRKTVINAQSGPVNIVVSADGTRGYVANYSSSAVSVLDLTNNAGLASIAVGPGPIGLALTIPPASVVATPLQLSFAGSAGQANPASQNVALSVNQTGTFTWSAAATTTSGGNWLSVGTATGSFPATLAISANISGLAPGNYAGTVSITSANTGNSPLTINVTLKVNPSGTLAVDQKQIAFQTVAGSPAPAPATVNLTNTGGGGNIAWTAVVSPVATWLTLSVSSGVTPASLTVTVNPQGLPTGQLSATVTISSTGSLTPATFTVSLTVLPGPTISSGGVVNGASFTAALGAAPGSLISIFGSNLGPATGVGVYTVPWPTNVSNVQVTIGGYPAPLFYVSASQINCQVPFELAGQTSAPVVVQNGAASSPPANLAVSAFSPGIYTAVVNGQTIGAILNQDYSQNTPANPAQVGQVIQIFANGQGAVVNAPADGAAAPGGPNLATTPANPVVLVGGQPATVAFSGLAPSFVGLWQINVTIPAAVTPGNAVPVQIIQGTAASNAANVAIVTP
jgi:uncharacterized protein (TIGR03437 family)